MEEVIQVKILALVVEEDMLWAEMGLVDLESAERGLLEYRLAKIIGQLELITWFVEELKNADLY